MRISIILSQVWSPKLRKNFADSSSRANPCSGSCPRSALTPASEHVFNETLTRDNIDAWLSVEELTREWSASQTRGSCAEKDGAHENKMFLIAA